MSLNRTRKRTHKQSIYLNRELHAAVPVSGFRHDCTRCIIEDNVTNKKRAVTRRHSPLGTMFNWNKNRDNEPKRAPEECPWFWNWDGSEEFIDDR